MIASKGASRKQPSGNAGSLPPCHPASIEVPPTVQGLGGTADLSGHRLTRRPVGRMIVQTFRDQMHGAFTNLRRVLRCLLRSPIHSKFWSLLQTQGGSSVGINELSLTRTDVFSTEHSRFNRQGYLEQALSATPLADLTRAVVHLRCYDAVPAS